MLQAREAQVQPHLERPPLVLFIRSLDNQSVQSSPERPHRKQPQLAAGATHSLLPLLFGAHEVLHRSRGAGCGPASLDDAYRRGSSGDEIELLAGTEHTMRYCRGTEASGEPLKMLEQLAER